MKQVSTNAPQFMPPISVVGVEPAPKLTQPPRRSAADRLLWQRHDRFVEAYSAMLSLNTKDASAGSLSKSTPKQRRAFEKWEAAMLVADRAARKVVDTPASTIHGMLMKVHLLGFLVDGCMGGTFSAPYHGEPCADGKPQSWKLNNIGIDRDEFRLIVSLRDDLHRIQAAQ